MLIRTLITAAALTTAAHADFDRQIPTNAQPDLSISTGSGRIHVTPGTDAGIHIVAHIRAEQNAGNDAQDRIRRISANPPINVSGNAVHVGEISSQDRDLYKRITIDYEVTAPKGVALYLRTGSGDLEIDNLGRSLKAETGSGSVRAHGIAGPADLRSGSGDIELQQNAAGDVRADTGSGSVRVNNLNGTLTARSGSGDIEANGALTGAAHLQSGSGSIRLHLGPNAHYNLEAGTGSGSIRFPGSGDNKDRSHHLKQAVNGGGATIEASTGSGDIEIN